jgi:hypothetical protein
MAEMDDVLAELRRRIMGPVESGPPKSVPEPVEAVTPLPARGALHPAMTQPVDLDQHHGSAAVALRRLAHPGRDGPVVAELSQLIKRLALDMPDLMEEVVTFIERRTAEPNETDAGAAPRPTESVAPAAPVRVPPTPQDDDTGVATVILRFDTQMLARIDADAKRRGISRTAWLHLAAGERLGEAGDDA